jgi:hypothetical protein
MLGGEKEGAEESFDMGYEGKLSQAQKMRLVTVIENDWFSKVALLKLLAAVEEHVASPEFFLHSNYSTGEFGFVIEFQARVGQLDSRHSPVVGGFLTTSDAAYTLEPREVSRRGV